MGLVDEVAGIWILRGRFTVWERCRRRPSERNPRLEATWHKLIKGSVHTYYVCSLAARLQGLNGVVRMDVVHRFAIDHDNLVFGAAEVQVYTGSQVFNSQILKRSLHTLKAKGLQLTTVVPWLVHLAAHLTPELTCPHRAAACPCLLILQNQILVWNPAI